MNWVRDLTRQSFLIFVGWDRMVPIKYNLIFETIDWKKKAFCLHAVD